MNCGFPVRPPPRRPATAGRIASVVCLLLLALAFSAGPAAAYPCGGSAASARTLSGHVAEANDNDCTKPWKRRMHRNADPISFAFFVGLLVAVVLVPVALGKREDSPPE